MSKTPTFQSKGQTQPLGSTWNSSGTHSRAWQRQSQKMRNSFETAAKGEAGKDTVSGKTGDQARATKDREPRKDELRQGAAKAGAKKKSLRPPKFAPKGRNGRELGG